MPVDVRICSKQIVQQRIVQRTRQDSHRLHRQRVHERVDLPEAEMAGEQQHALPLPVGGDDPLLSFEFHVREHPLPDRMLLNFSSTMSRRPKCENIPRAIARHSAVERMGNARLRLLIASRRCGPSRT